MQKHKNTADENRIVGQLIEAFGTKLIVAGLSVWVAVEAATWFKAAMAPVAVVIGSSN